MTGAQFSLRRLLCGIHTVAAFVVAVWITAEAIASYFGLRLLDGWEDGPWRSDPRFDVDPCDDSAPPRGIP